VSPLTSRSIFLRPFVSKNERPDGRDWNELTTIFAVCHELFRVAISGRLRTVRFRTPFLELGRRDETSSAELFAYMLHLVLNIPFPGRLSCARGHWVFYWFWFQQVS